jgi:hypothetical protein
MIWLIIIVAAGVILWRSGKYPFDRSYTVGGFTLPKYEDTK